MSENQTSSPKPTGANSLVFTGDRERVMFYPSQNGGLTIRLEWWPKDVLGWRYTTLTRTGLDQLETFLRDMRANPGPTLRACSFCGKDETEVMKLWEAREGAGVYICDECVATCASMDKNPASPDTPPT